MKVALENQQTFVNRVQIILTDASGVGVGVGIGSRPAPGSMLDNVGAGAKRERALASSGILPAGITIFMLVSRSMRFS